ncbi:DNA replication and repair protein RecF [Sinobacterium caligoides]|uniref:DNA replication and repair protein RecF n=1 Tax=Sinobacterium caligoides TaxID=933926 RepID=A0A3N2DGW2_9GAMM|nr:DNA replication/repair protein RecF [Sinobacterium caligoides]ROR99025.1 DNA replication and repair protein RecF [Sinobacterium caligoides]
MFSKLSITRVRNIAEQVVMPLAQINIFYGENGSGKTSILEAIHMVSLARSFRHSQARPVISRGEQSLVVHAQLKDRGSLRSVGIQRSLRGEPLIRIDGESVRSVSALASLLPVLVLDAGAFLLLEGSSKVRRQFLDWGVFHVEQNFLNTWKSYQRCLKQRNSLLRSSGINSSQMAIWDVELVRYAQAIDEYRKRYFQGFEAVFGQVLAELTELDGLSLHYRRGWEEGKELGDVLTASLSRDLQLGYTQYGAQRADLKIRYRGVDAATLLSRGQQKIVAAALKIAQGLYYKQLLQRPCIFLVDDLPAEIDKRHRQTLCDLFLAQDAQVFMTCIDKASVMSCFQSNEELEVFHVEHGCVRQQPSDEGNIGESND